MAHHQCTVCEGKLEFLVKPYWPLYRCLSCGLVQVSPRPTQKDVSSLYNNDKGVSYRPYSSQIQAHRKYFNKKIGDIYRLKSKGELLDVGCALGIFMQEAEKKGFKTHGIDISKYPVDYCRKLGLDVNQKTVENLDSKRKYDIISAFEIIEHVPDPLFITKKIYSHLKPQGLFVMTVPNTDNWTNRLMGKYWFGYRDREHILHFNRKSLEITLKKASFKRIKIEKDGARPYLFLYYLERINYYLLHLNFLDKIINLLRRVPLINKLEINLNSWGNLVAYAQK